MLVWVIDFALQPQEKVLVSIPTHVGKLRKALFGLKHGIQSQTKVLEISHLRFCGGPNITYDYIISSHHKKETHHHPQVQVIKHVFFRNCFCAHGLT